MCFTVSTDKDTAIKAIGYMMNLDTSTQQIIGLAIISLLLGYSLFYL